MPNSAMHYKHTISIEIETQHPKDEGVAELVKQVLGPWCTKATVVALNTPLENEE